MSKKSKTTTDNTPSKYSQQYITPAANALQSTYNANQPQAQNAANSIYSQLPDLATRAFSADPNVTAAQGYNTDVLNGKYLGAGNPYMSGMIDQTDRSVADRVNSTFGQAGRTGGDTHAAVLGRSLADAENTLRYGDYSNERNAMATAAGQAPSLAAGQYAGVAPYLASASGAASLPYIGAGAYASGTGGLVGQYNTSTTTQQASPFDNYMKLVSAAAQAAGAASDRRLKRNIEKVGELPDGLGVYDFDYVWDAPRQRGVMADEVEKLRPWALGAKVGGYSTVHYDLLDASPMVEA